ncbi:Elongation of very long chain fatty acids protein 6 [Acipenser ruthenus]|uniref:Elongation of very long chain fatty acids protein n=1 Tax=Acipenser ruthenus TaxID=7906 RepID=A0A444UXD4_ACIRT|nr:Elongation of very long chain fatty acids protein 6 [Acipenser ruthenus]
MDSSMSMADSEAYFSAAEEFEPISSDECPGTYPGRKKKKKHAQQINCSRNSIYHSVEGPLTYVLNGETIHEPRPLPIPTHPSQASFVSALGVEEESAEHVYSAEMENVPEVGQMTSQPHVMNCYQNYLSHYQVFNWLVKQPTNKRTSKSSLHRPLDLDTPTSEESSSSYDQLSIPAFKIVKHGLSANSLLDRGVQLMGSSSRNSYVQGDTIFIILRKQKLIFLHWYHHITVLLYSWYSYKDMVAGGGWFMTINYLVHAVMYSYYALRAAGFRVSRKFAMIITLTQITQMVVGCVVNYLVFSWMQQGQCPSHVQNIVWSSLMYLSYFVLFCRFFFEAYVHKSKKNTGKVE